VGVTSTVCSHWADKCSVLGHDGPAIAQFLDIPAPGVEHGLDGDGHAGLEPVQCAGFAVMQHLGFFVKVPANAVAAKLAHHTQAMPLGKSLDGMADITQIGTVTHLHDATPHRFVSQAAQTPRRDRHLADHEHAAGVAVPAVLDHRHVDVDDVPLLERLVVRDTVAYLLVDRGADGFGVGVVAAGRVVEWR
jgi:hypothetical protein